LRVDRESRWTLEPFFVRLENGLKILFWSLGFLVFAWAMVTNLSWSLGYIVGVPIVVGFLHATASKLTRRLAGVRFDLLWAVASLLLAAVFSVLILFVLEEFASEFPAPCWVALVPLFVVPFLTIRLARRLERWKAHRVRARMRAHGVARPVPSA
jgi:hypothetical protein